MNKRVLHGLIILMWLCLSAFIILKLFFGDHFKIFVENPNILMIGNIIDTRLYVRIAADGVVGFFCTYLYLCTCFQKPCLSHKAAGAVFVYSVLIAVLKHQFSWVRILDLILPLAIPLLFKAKWKQVVMVFVLHNLSQVVTLFLRSEPLYLVSTNYASQFVIFFDMYLWMILYYLYSILCKEETLWELLLHSFSAIRRKKSLKQNLQE